MGGWTSGTIAQRQKRLPCFIPEPDIVRNGGNVRFGSLADIRVRTMSALPPKPDMVQRDCDLRQLNGSKLPYLSRPQCGKTIRRNACRAQGVRKCEQRRVNRFIG